ncbi:Asp-tRNA(Asn)/Glu-tRNA(Gln) amidotransferase GatCAB subunit B, partial [Candidatus Woesearchaeota archaeon]|nr:Asp-tRNA(Asn)/Glu-tRNA(Gln) amidotransferase GatCAB subunit B [Candidatus Woesearchaeota archaeon]
MVVAKIGLEIHGYLRMDHTNKKLFCDCDISSADSKPNTNICPICTGQPGNKPQLPNEEAVRKIVACGLMLGC